MPPDQQPPILSLLIQESATITLQPYGTFDPLDIVHAVDFESSVPPLVTAAGADALQHYMSNPELSKSLPYDASAQAHGPITIVLSAVDGAGNEAVPIMLPLYISTPTAACPGEEIMCESGSCSTQGLCLPQDALDFLAVSGLLSSSDVSTGSACLGSADVCSYSPVHDGIAPVVTALGQPPEHVRVSGRHPGKIIVESSVVVGSPYRDAGAIALDAIDGDVSSTLSSSGLVVVDTRAPTLPGLPYVVKYAAIDSSGNVADPAERNVMVLCSSQYLACSFADSATYCSVSDSQCLEPSPRPALESNIIAPVVSLIGPAEVEIVQGTPYGACTEQNLVSLHCDRGATAMSSIEGDITWTVMACSDGYMFSVYGLQGCSLDTSIVGQHILTFFVMQGDVQVAANRTIWVVERCLGMCSLHSDESWCLENFPQCNHSHIIFLRLCNAQNTCAGSEVHCKDDSCSVDGACSSGHAEGSLALNTPPKIELLPVFAADSNGIVQVPHGWLYQFCEPGTLGTDQEPCEPGVDL